MDPILRLASRVERAAAPRQGLTPEERLIDTFASDPESAYRTLLDRYSSVLLRMIRRFFHDQDDVMDLYTVVCERMRAQDYRALRSFRRGSDLLPWLSVVVANASRDRLRQKRVASIPRHVLARLDERTRLVYRHHVAGHLAPEDAADVITRGGVPCTALDVVEELQRLHRLLRAGTQHRLLRHLDPREAVSLDALIERGLDQPDSAADLDDAISGASSLARLNAILATFTTDDRLIVSLRFEQELTVPEIADLVGAESPARIYTRLRTLLARLRRALGEDEAL